MLRSLKTKLRQLWEQCDLFEPAPEAPVWERPKGVLPSGVLPPDVLPPRLRPARPPKTRDKRRRKTRRPRTGFKRRTGRTPRTHAHDRELVERLAEAFASYNSQLFGGELQIVPIRISRRMKNRLGHYMAASPSGEPAEIAISRRHIHQDTWEEVLHTLVHEMVHQWQDENGLPIDHGQHFRRKAREIGISARATRPVMAQHTAPPIAGA